MYADQAKPARRPQLTVPKLREMKRLVKKSSPSRHTMPVFARAVDAAGLDVILVGDSLGMVAG